MENLKLIVIVIILWVVSTMIYCHYNQDGNHNCLFDIEHSPFVYEPNEE